ncbi:uncharacterized protein DDB_G0290587-like [Saccostrea echinata]|uniref:uncharacterized protein DDB_G0290587-like n=1 Tax=Saccostrea echinata TaxID=191078 RepID=UPI002A80A047|nr:uncharacterized protein DDB_G0290587-like [Saccostrea echinata]
MKEKEFRNIEETSDEITILESDNPILVTGFGMGSGYYNPYMTVIPGIHQYIDYYKIVVPEGYTNNYICVIIPNKFTNYLQINGSSFDYYKTVRLSSAVLDTTFSIRLLAVNSGPLVVSTTNKANFGLIIYGNRYDDGYGFAGNYPTCVFIQMERKKIFYSWLFLIVVHIKDSFAENPTIINNISSQEETDLLKNVLSVLEKFAKDQAIKMEIIEGELDAMYEKLAHCGAEASISSPAERKPTTTTTTKSTTTPVTKSTTIPVTKTTSTTTTKSTTTTIKSTTIPKAKSNSTTTKSTTIKTTKSTTIPKTKSNSTTTESTTITTTKSTTTTTTTSATTTPIKSTIIPPPKSIISTTTKTNISATKTASNVIEKSTPKPCGSRGREFLMLFMRNYKGGTEPLAIYITTENNTSVNISTCRHLNATIKSATDRVTSVSSYSKITLPYDLTCDYLTIETKAVLLQTSKLYTVSIFDSFFL